MPVASLLAATLFVVASVIAGPAPAKAAGMAFCDGSMNIIAFGFGTSQSAGVAAGQSRTCRNRPAVPGGRSVGATPVNMVCFYRDLTPREAANYAKSAGDGATAQGLMETHAILNCKRPGEEATERLVVRPEAGTPAEDLGVEPPFTAVEVATIAYANADAVLPPAQFSPSLGSAGGAAPLVNLPVWFWLDGVAPRTATADVGPVVSSVQLTPQRLWAVSSSGATSKTCTAPATPWAPGASESDPGACTLTFDRPVHGETISVYLEWGVTWTSNVGFGGTMPPITVSADYTTDVLERHAIVKAR